MFWIRCAQRSLGSNVENSTCWKAKDPSLGREEMSDRTVTAKMSPSPRRSLLLGVPLKSFLSEASDLGHLAPALTIGCGHFHGEGITLDQAVSLDQQQFLEILWATSSHQGSWENYDLDLGERAGQHATVFTVVTDCGWYYRLSLSPAWPLFSLSLSLVFNDCKLMEIQCSGHVFLFLSCFSPPIWYVCKFFQP